MKRHELSDAQWVRIEPLLSGTRFDRLASHYLAFIHLAASMLCALDVDSS